jgi:LmbE family N-acetylglucosaminyl deacetylase
MMRVEMRLSQKTAEVFAPDGVPIRRALARTTHLCLAAHSDDIEIMAPWAILECFGRADRWFCGVVATNGAGSPRADLYAKHSDGQMRVIRRLEQKKAAVVGEFGALAMLDHPSVAVKNPRAAAVRADIKAIMLAARPDVVITHNLADKHDTHVALALRTLESLRELPSAARPRKLFGGEVWRDLDWMPDSEKVLWDVSKRENIQAALLGVFDSQISGGKRYDLAAAARRRAYATYSQSRSVDAATGFSAAMDLTPLIRNVALDPAEYVAAFVKRFGDDVRRRLDRFL